MTTLEWNGEIGWGLWASDVAHELSEVSGDLTIRLSSVGGDIFEGADIFNALADHKRNNPGIKMNLEIKGVAASFGSAIAASPVWDSVSVEETSAFMIHNPWSIAIGDYRDMSSMADFLSKARDAWLGVYVKRSGKSRQEIGDMMDAETWMYGQSIVDAGFADKVLSSPASDGSRMSGSMVIEKYKMQFRNMQSRLRSKDSERFSEKRAAAALRRSRMDASMVVGTYVESAKLIDEPWDSSASEMRWRDHAGVEGPEDLPNDTYSKRFAWYDANTNDTFGAYKFPHWDYTEANGEFVNVAAVRNGLARIANSDVPEADKPRVERLLRRYLDRFNEEQNMSVQSPVPTGENQAEVPMDKEQLRKENPGVYDESVADGVMVERDRVKGLIAMKAQDAYKDIPEVQAVLDKAIEDGTAVDSVQPLVMAAMVKLMNDPARAQVIEGPGEIQGGNAETPQMSGEKIGEV